MGRFVVCGRRVTFASTQSNPNSPKEHLGYPYRHIFAFAKRCDGGSKYSLLWYYKFFHFISFCSVDILYKFVVSNLACNIPLGASTQTHKHEYSTPKSPSNNHEILRFAQNDKMDSQRADFCELADSRADMFALYWLRQCLQVLPEQSPIKNPRQQKTAGVLLECLFMREQKF